MINIYVSMKQASKSGKHIIAINDIEFLTKVSKDDLTNLDKKFIQEIDNVSEINGVSITTPFDVTDIYNLSTGCKTIININHVINQIGYNDYPIVDITECEGNLIATIFDLIDDTKIEVLLRHSLINLLPRYKYVFNVIGVDIVKDLYRLAALIDGTSRISNRG